MAAPSQAQLSALKALFGAVNDDVLLTLDRAFVDGNPGMTVVRSMISDERRERGLRDAVFAPVTPLFRARLDGPTFPKRLVATIWSVLKVRAPDLIDEARDASRYLRAEDAAPRVFDELCVRSGMMLRAHDRAILREGDEAMADELACYIDLAPLARKSLHRLPDWLGRVSEDRTAALKIALRDASAMMEDGAPRLLDLFQCNLPEPQLILRLIAVATDRSGDRYLADSEMSRFGERLLADVERRVERIRNFDPQAPVEQARTVGDDVTAGCAVLAEFERSMELSRDGPWGKRVTAARRGIAGNVETRLRDLEDAIAKALPMQKVKMAGRMTRAAPVLDRDPDPVAVARARGLLVLTEVTRASAQVGGYGALRNSIVEKVRERLDDYADEVLHQINALGGVDDARPRAWLELAAEFLERVDGAKSAQLVRRRAAAAGVAQTHVA
jgi:hypothetical protein